MAITNFSQRAIGGTRDREVGPDLQTRGGGAHIARMVTATAGWMGIDVNHLGCPPSRFKGAPTEMVKMQALIAAVWAINAARGWQRFSRRIAPAHQDPWPAIPVIPVHGGAARPISDSAGA